jgi:hypothetical protein
MMNHDQYGAEVRAAYDVYVLALTGTYLGFKAAGRGPDAVTELRQRGLGLLDTLMNSVHAMTGRYLNELPDGSGVGERETYWRADLQRIAVKNLNDLIVRMMGLGLQRPADLLTQPAGAVGLLLQQKMSRPHFTARDSAGRAWDAAKLVSLLARDFAYQTYVDVMLARAAALGADRVAVVYADPARNTVLDLAEAVAGRRQIFHVNGSARIQTHVPTNPTL